MVMFVPPVLPGRHNLNGPRQYNVLPAPTDRKRGVYNEDESARESPGEPRPARSFPPPLLPCRPEVGPMKRCWFAGPVLLAGLLVLPPAHADSPVQRGKKALL